jgi:hypothetical protein
LANNSPDKLPVTVPLPAWLGPVPPLQEKFGATPLGLIYGSLALAIFIFAALLGWRRSHPSWKIGRIQGWLKAHIWLTVFTIPLVLLHGGFHWGGPMTSFLMGLYILVMISGFWGLALQHIVPRIMRDSLPEEVIFEEIPFIRGQLLAEARAALERLVESAGGETEDAEVMTASAAPPAPSRMVSVATIVEFFERETLPYLQATRPRGLRLRDERISDDLFRMLRLQVPESLHPVVDHVRDLCDEKRRLDFQVSLHRWLHGWLFVHAPASLLLVVLTVWHAIVATLAYA